MNQDKIVVVQLKVYLNAGEAKVTPPLGPLLGQFGVNTVQFCKEFNEATEGFLGFFEEDALNIPFELIVNIFVYDDRKFSFHICKPSSSFLLRALAGVQKGDPKSCPYNISSSDLIKVALFKYPRERLFSTAVMLKGTARSIGIKIII